jgi:HK97 family phage prohead protease
MRGGIEERSSAGGVAVLSDPSTGSTLRGHFAVFNQWTTIDSLYEGRFVERIAPGAFREAERDHSGVRVLFNHGHDPSIGDKVLGPIHTLREDERGAYFEVPLLDTSYTRDLIPALEEGLYGSSFRFQVMRQSIDERPARSSYNPEALPERTIREARLFELGPVTFPAYSGATAGLA